jgi:hypothetical protein
VLYCDLLRITVLLSAAVATVLGTISLLIADRDADEVAVIVAVAWWLAAAAIGLWLGRSSRASASVAGPLAGARTATSLPAEGPTRIAFLRLWPIGAFALIAGGLAWVWPQVAAIGAGYAILTALAWRRRDAAVTGIEERDGVRFYVEASSAFEPVRLIRTPGLYRDRPPPAKAPPPPPAID